MRKAAFCIGNLFLLILVIVSGQRKKNVKDEDMEVVRRLQPLRDDHYIMFWRPQKVGSSTLLSILMSYGYRYNLLPKRKSSSNSFCRLIARCAMDDPQLDLAQRHAVGFYASQNLPGSTSDQKYGGSKAKGDSISLSVPWRITLSHEICNFNRSLIDTHLRCAFDVAQQAPQPSSSLQRTVSEVFMVREPLSRAVSVYYFWGELYKLLLARKGKQRTLRQRRKHSSKQRQLTTTSPDAKILGSVDSKGEVQGSMFRYHGSELTVPPLDVALDFARDFPYRAGMPGPSFTWSSFANSHLDAMDKIKSDVLFTVVLERLDESLVALRHHLNWTLADVVVTKQRKALSQHPKVAAWPVEAVEKIKMQLQAGHEFEVYAAAADKLDSRLSALQRSGVDVAAEIQSLRTLRDRVTRVCLNDSYLLHYREAIAKTGLPAHPSNNKLRDVEQKYQDDGHLFSFNREILCSFDVCGACEAHAMLLAVQRGVASSLETAPTLFDLPPALRKGNINFEKCPLPPS